MIWSPRGPSWSAGHRRWRRPTRADSYPEQGIAVPRPRVDDGFVVRRYVLGLSVLCVLAVAVTLTPAYAADPLSKAISMSGPQPLREDNHPNDYRAWGNRQYFKDSHSGWVKLWVSWYDLQQAYAATSRDGSWNNLTGSAIGSAYLKRLDGQIRAANDDGVRTVVTIYQAFPTWASG